MEQNNLLIPNIDDIKKAYETVSKVVQNTPIESSTYLAKILGVPKVWMKCENLQRTGSYKIRGAYNRLSKLNDEEKKRGVVAASAGNHAQGVAFAASQLGIKARIYTPIGVALPKLQATRSYNAEVVLSGHNVEESLAAASEYSRTTGAIFIPPFDHFDVVAGQASVAVEIFQEISDVDTIIVPVGGGGLISGVALYAKKQEKLLGKKIKVIGVQSENAAPYQVSLSYNAPTKIEIKPTIADGIAVSKPGEINFEIVKNYVDEIVTVSDDDIARALLMLLERAKMVVEPAGAAGVAAIMAGKIAPKGTTVTILSGGNIDPLLMQRVVSHGLAASDRYLKLKVMLPDIPGQLARTAEIVSEANANVVEVLHTRHGGGLPIGEVELELHIETRGPDHRAEVVRKLVNEGYRIR